ncbi:MAG TPA: CHRD domain-containing protein [Chitinophagales bacterium]|nr:CHRD domain-containing protein [Chitinophagales bacterium]
MKKSLLIAFLLFAFSQSKAISFKEDLLFTATINGMQAIPAVSTSANGIGSFMLNQARNAISVNISFAMLSGTPVNVSIYQGAEGTNGTLFLDLTPFIAGNRIATTITGTDVTANLAKYFSDDLYVLVKTASNPAGEIRGQIKLETDLNFVTDLNSMETIPMIMVSTAYGLGSFGLSMDNSKLNFKVICQGLTGAITSAKLYAGTIGMIGEEVADISSFIDGNVITGSLFPPASMLGNLLIGEIYLNITTAENPTGELRSQLVNYKGLTFDGILDGAQMVPPVATPAEGVCVIRFSPDLVTMYYDIVVEGVASSIDYAHLHIGEFGQPYNSTSFQVDFTSTIEGNRIKGTKTNISETNKDRLLTSELTLLIHTAAYPQGEIRSQIVRYAREGFTINLEGEQVVPAVASAAYGSGIVSISRDEENAHYNWVAGNLSATPTAAHFKNNVVGQNGPILYHMGPAMSVVENNVSANGFWKSSDTTPFLSMNSAQFSADSVYLDVQNSAFPGGEIRGQVLDGYVTYILGTNSISSDFDFLVYPNPGAGQIILSIPAFKNTNATIEVFDLLGRIAFSEASSGIGFSEFKIDLSTLSKGNYILRVSNNDQFATKKITLN